MGANERSKLDAEINKAEEEFRDKERQLLIPEFNYSVTKLKPVEYVIDGFIANKVTLIAGPPGVGKTSLLVPLAAQAAHLFGNKSDLNATLRRRVAYVTEDPEQVERVLYGLFKNGLVSVSEEEFRHWFTIITATRETPERVSNMISNIRDEMKHTLGDEFNGFEVEPLIILDTQNATIDLDNENDNAEAGKAISLIKSAVGPAPLWIVAHTAKVASREDVKTWTARGAGAFGGDVNATAFIINVNDTRFMVLDKRRFEADFTEIKFRTESYGEDIVTPWGKVQHVRYRYGIPEVAERDERVNAKSIERELVSKQADDRIKGAIIQEVNKAFVDKEKLSKTQIKNLVTGSGKRIGELVDELVEKGVLTMTEGSNNTKWISVDPEWNKS